MAEEIVECTNLNKLDPFIVVWATFLDVELEDGRKFLRLTEARYHSMTLHFMIYTVLQNTVQWW